MREPWKVLVELAATDSKNEKQAIVKRESDAGNDEFFRGVRAACDSMITFGVKQIAESTTDGAGLASADFWTVAQKLAERELTGGAAQDAIDQLRQAATKEQWNGWYRRVLIKDLKAGFSESTVNKAAAGQYQIPVFECQLAQDCVDEEGNVDEARLHGKKQVDVKLDGMRVLTFVYPTGNVVQYSRNGKELFNFTKIKEQFVATAHLLDEPMVFDGEVMGASFQDLMKQSRRKSDVQADDSVLNLFDILTVQEFLQKKSQVPQSSRSRSLQAWYATVGEHLPNVTVIGHEVVDLDTAAGQARLYEINAQALAGKYEGIMLKDVDAVYECKRSGNWLKMKPFIEESLTVVGVEEGKADSKFVGTMGALVCEDIVNGKKVRTNVGGGFSIQQRAQIWADHTSKPVAWQKKVKGKWETITEQPAGGGDVVGRIAEIRADALTKAEDSDTWSMRFPRFKTWRGFVRGEKL